MKWKKNAGAAAAAFFFQFGRIDREKWFIGNFFQKFGRSDNEFGRIDRDKWFIGNFFQKFGRSDNEFGRIDTKAFHRKYLPNWKNWGRFFQLDQERAQT